MAFQSDAVKRSAKTSFIGNAILLAIAIAVAAGVTAIVVVHAWVSDDAMITLRYASNLVHGYGPVFNAGERVQGFTHPLWLLLAAPAVAIDHNPLDVAVALGSVMTFVTVAIMAVATLRRATDIFCGVCVIVAMAAVLGTSEAWVSFQTSGLEGSLAGLLLALLALEVSRRGRPRPALVVLLAVLLFLARPDYGILMLPIGCVAVVTALRERHLLAAVAAIAPAAAWEGFAVAYYRAPLPNTVVDKVGIYGSLRESSAQGVAYVVDWVGHEPVAAAVAAGLLVVAIVARPERFRCALAIGLLLYVGAVVVAGGDFMRGRFLGPVFFTCVCLGSLALADAGAITGRAKTVRPRGWDLVSAGAASTGGGPETRRYRGRGSSIHEDAGRFEIRYARSMAIAAVVTFGSIAGWLLAPAPDATVSARGIVNEREFYRGFQLATYRTNHVLRPPGNDLGEAMVLRSYASACGPFTIHSPTPGALAYFSGPKVSFIDTIGLTDSYVARLPRSSLVAAHPRPGHPIREIPVAYLASRHDVAMLDGWWESVVAGDCSLGGRTERYVASNLQFEPLTALPP